MLQIFEFFYSSTPLGLPYDVTGAVCQHLTPVIQVIYCAGMSKLSTKASSASARALVQSAKRRFVIELSPMPIFSSCSSRPLDITFHNLQHFPILFVIK